MTEGLLVFHEHEPLDCHLCLDFGGIDDAYILSSWNGIVFSHLKMLKRYKVIEVLAGGGCALVEWRLETGRTHQIRAHAKYLGIPLLGDDVYGGTKSMALSLLQSRNPSMYHAQLFQLVDRLDRPCLHALTLGFRHPKTGENLSFSQIPPPDFAEILDQLRSISTEKVAGNLG